MKRLLLFYSLYFVNISNSNSQVIVSLVSQFEGQIVTIYSDTIQAKVYYTITGYESVGNIVLNAVTIFADKTEIRKEFDIISFSRNEEENTTDITVKSDEGNVRYFFDMKEYVLLTQTKKGNFLWKGDIIF
jgi:hypothetical protein